MNAEVFVLEIIKHLFSFEKIILLKLTMEVQLWIKIQNACCEKLLIV